MHGTPNTVILQDTCISQAFSGKYKIEAEAPNGNRGPLAVWGLQLGDENGLYVRWYNGEYDNCISPGCDFYITALEAAVEGYEYDVFAGDCVDASGEYTYIAHYGPNGGGFNACKSACDSLLSDCKAFPVSSSGLCRWRWVSVRQDDGD